MCHVEKVDSYNFKSISAMELDRFFHKIYMILKVEFDQLFKQ
jgi:hypothetical protein